MTAIKVWVFWDQGANKFRVRLTRSESQIYSLDGSLPALPSDLEAANQSSYSQWRVAYRQFEAVRRVCRIHPIATLTESEAKKTESEAREASSQHKQSVIESLNQWLNNHDSDWQPIREELIAVLSHLQQSGQEVRLFLDTEHSQFRRLPWQEWDLFKTRFPQAEVAVRLQRSRTRVQPIHKGSKVQVLAVIGQSDGINTQFDLEIIQALTQNNAEVTVLEKPTREELSQALRQEQGYHLFVFAGHSSSHPDGTIGSFELNDHDSIPIEEFKNSFRKAIQQGLQLAIFNSCHGLGLANQLAELGLPRSIVMREPIPDEVAVKFLKYFFQEFTQNKSLFRSIHLSRERLVELGFENKYPGVSWLPTLCVQEVTLSNSLTWQDFLKPKVGCLPLIKPLGIIASLAIIAIGASVFFRKNSPDNFSVPAITEISSGAVLLISSNTTPEKEAGILDYKNEDYGDAIEHFIKSLNQNPNDPETIIYLNNAIAQQKVETNTGKKVEIAVSVPITNEPNVSQEMLRGVAQAQSQLNCGLQEVKQAIVQLQTEFNCSKGINNTFLQVTIADDKYQPAVAEKVAQAFVSNPNILGVIGHYSSDMTLQAGSVYDKYKLVAISPVSTSVSLSNFSPYVLRTVPHDGIAAQQLFEYMRQQVGENAKVAVAYVPGNAYSESLTNKFKNSLPSNSFVHQCDLSISFLSAAECVKNAKQQEAEVLLLVPATDETLIKVVGIINNTNGELQLFGGDSVYNPRTLKDSGEKALRGNLVVAVPWHRSLDSEFSQQAKDFWKAPVSWRTASGYDATQAIIQALDESHPNFSRSQLYRKLSNPNFVAEGAEGPISFTSSGDLRAAEGVLVEVQEDDNGNYTFKKIE